MGRAMPAGTLLRGDVGPAPSRSAFSRVAAPRGNLERNKGGISAAPLEDSPLVPGPRYPVASAGGLAGVLECLKSELVRLSFLSCS
jgi:hypothetical protein